MYIDINDFKSVAHEDIKIKYDGKVIDIYFDTQKTGFGEKIFFMCSLCGRRRTKLYYYDNEFICRDCYPDNIYKPVQHTTKGGFHYICYRMERYASSRGIKIKRYPFHYLEYALEKPKYRRVDKWIESINILQALENMRFQTYTLGKKWNTKTVNSVVKGENTFLYLFELYEIQKYIINWDLGVDMNLKFNDKVIM